ncbi:MAG: hypothetical protein IPM14_03215 [bacterium]|nr:hypothetical protein [bacterium]
METSNFLLDCLIAIAIVFFVLGILSLSIRLLILFFAAETMDADDSAVMNAITDHYSKSYPHLRITKIEEQK